MKETATLIDERKVTLLDVGSGPEGNAGFFFPNATIFRLDADEEFNADYVHDIREPFPKETMGRFDIAFCSHILEHVERAVSLQVIKNLKATLKDGGELWIIVPSLEWCGKELLKDKPSPIVLAAIYGSQETKWQYHHTGYTLHLLRQLVEKAGLVARSAYQGPFTVTLNGTEYEALQNFMVSMRHDATDHTIQQNGSEPDLEEEVDAAKDRLVKT